MRRRGLSIRRTHTYMIARCLFALSPLSIKSFWKTVRGVGVLSYLSCSRASVVSRTSKYYSYEYLLTVSIGLPIVFFDAHLIIGK